MEIMDAERLKEELPFDLYGRYAITRDIINVNRNTSEPYRILDVGGRGNLLQLFLPDDDIYYLDPNVDPDERDENYLEGDGCDIPGDDERFDFVVSADVFEHIAPARRAGFLKENLRSSRLGVILAAPFYSGDVEQAEALANESYRIISGGQDHVWLKEHIKFGLPHEHEVEDYLSAGGFAFQKISNNALWLWELLVCIHFIARDVAEPFRDLNHIYNDRLYHRDNEEHSYRKIYFIKKVKDLKGLETGDAGMDISQDLEVIHKAFNVMAHIYAAKKAEIRKLIDATERLHQDLQGEQEVIRQKQKEIDEMVSTRSWKITKPLRDFNAFAQKFKRRG